MFKPEPIELTQEIKNLKLLLFRYARVADKYGQFERGICRRYKLRGDRRYSANYLLGKLCTIYVIPHNGEEIILQDQDFSTVYLLAKETFPYQYIILKHLKYGSPTDTYCLAIIHCEHQFIQVGNNELPQLICSGGREALYLVKADAQFGVLHYWDKKTRYHAFERGIFTTSTIPNWD
jgi:hypothetical protein